MADQGDVVADLRARIAELERIVEDNARQARFSRFLRNVNTALVSSVSSAEMFDRICRSAVADAGFTLAWVGAQDDGPCRVRPMCAHGPSAGYVEELAGADDSGQPGGRHPTGRCMLEKRTIYMDDFGADPLARTWRDLGEKYAIGSSASAPLVVRGKSRQALTFCSSRPGFFDAEAKAVIEECAERVSLTLATLDAERELVSRNRLLGEMSVMALIGAWEMDPRTGEITASDETAAIFEVEQAETFGVDDLPRLFPEPDATLLRGAAAEATARGTPFDLELKRLAREGTRRWVRVIGAADLADGQVRRVFGAVQDITPQKLKDFALRDSHRFNQVVLDSVSDEIAVLDKDGVIIAVNEPWRRFAAENAPAAAGDLGIGADYLAACRSDPAAPDPLAAEIAEGIRQVIDRRLPLYRAEYPCHAPDEERWFSVRVTPMALGAGAAVVVHTDITARRRAITVLAESEDRYRSLMMAMTEGVVLQDENSAILAFNDSATRILGLTADQLRGRTSFDPSWRSIHEDGTPFPGETHPVPETLRTGHPQSGVVMGIHKPDGALTWISISAQPLFRGDDTRPYRVVATMVDITEQKRIEAELIRSARHDALTGLLNRLSFSEAVRAAMASPRGHDRTLAVLLLDLDHFKDVNDTLGHGAGDILLKALSERLQGALRDGEIIARFGGDEFAILLPAARGLPQIDRVARALLAAIHRPFELQGAEMRVGASLGVALADGAVADAAALLSRADVALYRAKDRGRGRVEYFTEAMDVALRRRVVLGHGLHRAIEGGELRLAYQPLVEAGTGAIIGAEALARWDHPERGEIGPGEFIPIAESLGLAPAIGRWVIGDVCRQIRAWLDMGLSPPTVAVNLSATQFAAPGELERDLEAALSRHGVTPDRLELELTETVLMESATVHNDTLLRLRRRGFSLSIDDFGTGYSSLDYLRRFPADRIKIDQNFVKEIDSTRGAEAIVKAVIGLARQLGMGVIAEGVETGAHRDLLRQWDCWQMQGYFFSRPVSAEALTELLRSGRPLP